MLTVASVVNLVWSQVYHMSIHLCLQHVCRDAMLRSGLSATADTCWTSWNSKFKHRTKQCAFVIGFTDNVDIPNAFADNFASVCHHNSAVHNDRLRLEFRNKFVNYTGSVDTGSSCLFDCDTVQMAIAELTSYQSNLT